MTSCTAEAGGDDPQAIDTAGALGQSVTELSPVRQALLRKGLALYRSVAGSPSACRAWPTASVAWMPDG